MSDFADRTELPRIGKPTVQRAGVKPGERVSDDVLIASVVDGSDLHHSLRELAWRGWTEPQLCELIDRSDAKEVRPVDWEKRRRGIKRLVDSATKKRAREAAKAFGAPANTSVTQTPPLAPGAAQPLPELPRLRPSDMAARKVKPREWVVEPLIPKGEPTLLYGKGASGKSLALLQLGICIATGEQWLGCDVPLGRVLFFTCEDNTDELTRRAVDIFKVVGVDWDDLEDRLLIIPMRDCEVDATLAFPGGNGLLHKTQTYEALKAVADDFQPDVIMVDTLADTFAGNENARSEAKQFVKILSRLRIDATHIVTAHLSVSAEEDGRGFSGSTGWPGAVRSNLTFGRPKEERLKAFGDVRLLENKKANYTAEGNGAILMRWENGAFVPLNGFTMQTPEADVDALFLSLLSKLSAAGRYVSETRAAGTLAKEAQALEAGVSRRELEAAMLRLFDARRITNEEYKGPNSSKKMRLAVLDPNSPTPWKPG